MRNKLTKKTAAVMAAALIGSGVYTPVGNGTILDDILTASAEEQQNANLSFDEGTGLLTISGSPTRDEVRNFVNKSKVKKVVCAEKTKFPVNSAYLFRSCSADEEIDLTNADTSGVTDMSAMFYGCSALTKLNISKLNTSSVTSMSEMLKDCKKLDVSNFNTENVRDMNRMFDGCSELTGLNLSHFSLANISTKGGMLAGCTTLKPEMVYAMTKSLTLGGNLGVNFYIKPGEKLAKVVLSGPNGDIEITDLSGCKIVDEAYQVSYPINATHADANITLKAYDKNGKRLIVCNKDNELLDHSQADFSLNSYITELRKTDGYKKDSKLAALTNSLDNFCKAADNIFNGSKNTIEGIEDVTKDSVKDYAPEFGSKIKLSLVLNSKTAVRLYAEGSNVKLDKGDVIEPTSGKYGSYYEIRDIAANDLGKEHSITIDGQKYKFTPLAYAYRVLNNDDASPALKDIAKAAYIYAKASEAFLGK